MNFTLIGGMVVCFGLVIYGIIGGGNDIIWYYDFSSVMITVLGSIAATIAATPLSDVKNLGKWFSIAFKPPKYDPKAVITELIEYATVARSKGLLALEESANNAKDPFMKQALMLIVDSNDPDKVRDMLENSLDHMAERHNSGSGFFATAVSMGPAFGMIGTLIGLVAMLRTMGDNPDSLGASMAVAIITTFYCSLLANAIFAPIESSLKNTHTNEEFCKTIIIEGVMSIAQGSNPRAIEEKLMFMLPKSAANVKGGKK